MSLPLPYTVPEVEPTEDEVRQWQAEIDRDRRAADRTPVAMIPGAYELPLVITRDGAVFQLLNRPYGELGERQDLWSELPPIPGSPRAMSGEYRTPMKLQALDDAQEWVDRNGPFLPADEVGGPSRQNGAR